MSNFTVVLVALGHLNTPRWGYVLGAISNHGESSGELSADERGLECFQASRWRNTVSRGRVQWRRVLQAFWMRCFVLFFWICWLVWSTSFDGIGADYDLVSSWGSCIASSEMAPLFVAPQSSRLIEKVWSMDMRRLAAFTETRTLMWRLQ